MAVSYKDYGAHNPIRVFTVTLIDGAEVATITTDAQDVTVTGITTDDVLIGFEYQQHDDGLALASAYISADDTVTCTFVNPTAGALTPTADATYTFTVIKGA
jgi:hypothetical protein